MIRIRCFPSRQEQTVLFCQNNNIAYFSSENGFDFVFSNNEDAYEVSNFLIRLEELDRIDKLKEEEVYPLGMN